MNIPIAKPFFDDKDLEIIRKPLESGWVVQGPFVKEFENKFCKFTSSKYSVAVSSCTTALHVALDSIGITKGDEVIVPAFSWVATANAVEYCGATPVFCDINLRSFNIDTSKIESLLTSKTKAIIPVHLFGLPADIDSIKSIASKYDLKIIEDAACGFGSYYKGTHVGNFGEAGCFSFHPRKAITTGEGGMITTSNENIAAKCRELRDHGSSGNSGEVFLLPEYNSLGYNYRMTDLQASLGVSQIEKAEFIQNRRLLAAEKYDEILESLDWLDIPLRIENTVHGFQSYVCLFKPEQPTLENYKALSEKRNELMRNLEKLGIATRQGTHAITNLGFYKQKYNIIEEDFPNALFAEKLSIALPLYAGISNSEIEYVTDNLISSFSQI